MFICVANSHTIKNCNQKSGEGIAKVKNEKKRTKKKQQLNRVKPSVWVCVTTRNLNKSHKPIRIKKLLNILGLISIQTDIYTYIMKASVRVFQRVPLIKFVGGPHLAPSKLTTGS